MITSTQHLTDRFCTLIGRLCHAVSAGNAEGQSPEPFIHLVWEYLRRLAARFATLAARAEVNAGKPARPRPERPRPVLVQRSVRVLPQDWGWLAKLLQEPAPFHTEFHALVATPEMAALFAADPQLGKILRPLSVSLGAGLPPQMHLPPTPSEVRAAECRQARNQFIPLKLRNRLGMPLLDPKGRPWLRPTLKRWPRLKPAQFPLRPRGRRGSG